MSVTFQKAEVDYKTVDSISVQYFEEVKKSLLWEAPPFTHAANIVQQFTAPGEVFRSAYR